MSENKLNITVHACIDMIRRGSCMLIHARVSDRTVGEPHNEFT